MKPNEQFLKQPKHFWANVRAISQLLGYTHRSTNQLNVPTAQEVKSGLQTLGLTSNHILDEKDQITSFGQTLFAYFQYRADVLKNYVEPHLMDVTRARDLFNELRANFTPTNPYPMQKPKKGKNPGLFPMNKQSGGKKDVAFFTAIIYMLIDANIGKLLCNFNPGKLTTVTFNNAPLRTLARRVDGAFPGTVNPIAIWEIKEYYYTKTFGSRVADGVYETLLDGMELEELREHEKIDVKHYLMVDDHNTWWKDGKSYLCRMVDMIHMGYVDEVLFGYEVVDRLPALAKEWVDLAQSHPEVITSAVRQKPNSL